MAKRWIQVAPKGEFPHAAGVVQVIDDEAVAAMAESFDSSAKLLLDFDHYSSLTDEQRAAVDEAGVQLPSEAAGWVEAVEAREDGLYVLAEMTPAGEQAIANAEYRFTSPVWLRGDCESAGRRRVRPMKLHKVALTNEPNLRGIAPLTNRKDDELIAGPMVELKNAVGVESPSNFVEPEPEAKDGNTMDYKALLIEMLGLAADATDEQIAEAMAAMKNSAEADKAKVEESKADADAAKAKADEMENRAKVAEKAAQDARVDADLATFADAIQDKDSARALLMANREAAVKTFEAVLKAQALPNRAAAQLPSGDGGETKPILTGIDRTIAAFRKG